MSQKSALPTEDALRLLLLHGSTEPKRDPYPPETHEDVLWLRAFVHRRFADNLHALLDLLRRKGIDYDYNYFYQVLTGRYFRRDAEGKVQGSARNLQKLVRDLRVYDGFAAKLAALRFVETTTWHRLSDYIDTKSAAFAACRFGAIVGHTGTQKSASFREKARRGKPGQFVHLESPAQASLPQLRQKVGMALGARLSDSPATVRSLIARTITEDSVLIIDNVQRCFHSRRASDQPCFSWLQELQEETNCTVLLSWTPDSLTFEDALKTDYFEQFIGRIGGEREVLRLPLYPPDEDVEQIALQCGLPAGDLPQILPRLCALVRERGRVRNLFNALQLSRQDANMRQEPFRAAHVIRYLGE